MICYVSKKQKRPWEISPRRDGPGVSTIFFYLSSEQKSWVVCCWYGYFNKPLYGSHHGSNQYNARSHVRGQRRQRCCCSNRSCSPCRRHRRLEISLVLNDERNVFHLRFSSMAWIQISRSWRHGLGDKSTGQGFIIFLEFPENMASQKENSVPTTIFHELCRTC